MPGPIPIFYSDRFLSHNTGLGHPENAGRLTAVVKALQSSSFAAQIDWRSPTEPAERGDVLDWVHQLHSQPYVAALKQLCDRGGGHIDGDTVASADSYDVALLAVSAWLDGVDQVLTTHRPGFVLSRPPGHHAVGDRGMGFCLFSNAAIAAHYALSHPQVNRVAILDWDVHHGNGTQALVEMNRDIVYCSLHQSPCYPGTGSADETGFYDNILNLPVAPGSTLADYQPLFETKVLPFLQAASPDLLLVSAGYDANGNDPLAGIKLKPEDYGYFTRAGLSMTSKVLFGLEGGYHYASLSQSVLETLSVCLKPSSINSQAQSPQ
ncbi:MAG: histone deacetylase [Cyanobacteria bacterium P01_D01_bin.128]